MNKSAENSQSPPLLFSPRKLLDLGGQASIRNAGNHQFIPEKSRKLGKYLIGETIGQGSYGKVKIGMHVSTQQKVAIKVLEKKRVSLTKELVKLTRELRVLKRARHPNIAQLYEVFKR